MLTTFPNTWLISTNAHNWNESIVGQSRLFIANFAMWKNKMSFLSKFSWNNIQRVSQTKIMIVHNKLAIGIIPNADDEWWKQEINKTRQRALYPRSDECNCFLSLYKPPPPNDDNPLNADFDQSKWNVCFYKK